MIKFISRHCIEVVVLKQQCIKQFFLKDFLHKWTYVTAANIAMHDCLLLKAHGTVDEPLNLNLNLFFALLPVRPGPLILERDRSTNSVLTTQCHGSGATDQATGPQTCHQEPPHHFQQYKPDEAAYRRYDTTIKKNRQRGDPMIELCRKRSHPLGNGIITRTSKKNGHGTRRDFRDMPNTRLCVRRPMGSPARCRLCWPAISGSVFSWRSIVKPGSR